MPVVARNLISLSRPEVRLHDLLSGCLSTPSPWIAFIAITPISTSDQVDGLQIVSVDVLESPAEVTAWQAKFGITYYLVIDRDGRLNNLYQLGGLPTTYFIGRDGIIRDIMRGPLDSSGLESRVRDLLRK